MAEHDEPEDRLDDEDTIITPKREERRAHPSRLLARAAAVGIDQAEADLYTPAELLQAIQIEQHRLDQEDRAKPKPQVEAVPEIDWGVGEDGQPLNEKSYLPGVAAAIRRQHAAEQKAVERERKSAVREAKLQEKLDGIEKRELERERARQLEQFDRLCAAYPETLGTGAHDELDPNSRAFKRRAKLWNDIHTPGAAGSLRQRFKESYDDRFGEAEEEDEKPRRMDADERRQKREPDLTPRRRRTPEEAELNGIEVEQERWAKNNGTANPSHRRGPVVEEEPRKKAAKAVRDVIRKRGIVAQDDGDEEGLLPE